MEMETSLTAKFVSKKINKIRWRPVSQNVIVDSTVFATGSWDDEVNTVGIWSNEENRDEGRNDCVQPTLLCEVPHNGDVTDLIYVNCDNLLAASSSGSITLYQHRITSDTLAVSHQWQSAHHFPTNRPCPCTAVASRGDDMFVSAGEDGRLQLYNMDQPEPVRTIEKADSCTINSVLFLKQNEVAAVNSTGQLKVWDVRQSDDEPANIFVLTGDKMSLHCIDKHPTQPHIVTTGSEDGALCIWDMRQTGFPVTLLNAHSADMWEVRFHPSSPDNLFSCSQDGSVYHWDSYSMRTSSAMPSKDGFDHGSSWLASEATAKHHMNITSLHSDSMPVNSIDIINNTLLCATDSEKIVTFNNVAIK